MTLAQGDNMDVGLLYFAALLAPVLLLFPLFIVVSIFAVRSSMRRFLLLALLYGAEAAVIAFSLRSMGVID